jgi:hypothetical protein
LAKFGNFRKPQPIDKHNVRYLRSDWNDGGPKGAGGNDDGQSMNVEMGGAHISATTSNPEFGGD